MIRWTLIVFALQITPAVAVDRPNIVALYSDDAGYADFGFQPGVRRNMKNLTPNIDSIARDGARFTNAYMAGCVCSPSRAGLMTGRYPQRFGYDNNLPPGTKDGLSLDETFGAKRLQKLGYQTGLVGSGTWAIQRRSIPIKGASIGSMGCCKVRDRITLTKSRVRIG